MTGPDHDEVVDVPLLDYHEFGTPEDFDDVKVRIQAALAAVIMSHETVWPAAVLFHNSSLGKNVAASAAFAETARQWGCDQIRFFPILHDFAEEGRTAMINQINTVGGWGRPIYEDLYCAGAPVTFVVPGKQTFQILDKLNFPVKLLPNSVRAGIVDSDKDALRAQLTIYAKSNCFSFDVSRPLWYHSSRIIRRKNILETVFLSIVMEAALVLGPEGTSVTDAPLTDMLQELVQKYRLNILINPLERECFRRSGADPVSVMYALCDYAVTTSVAEGFGFGLYEPFLYDRPLLGRHPCGFMYPCDVSTDNLYTVVPVPAVYVEKNELIRRYYEKFGHTENAVQKAESIKNAELLDFADLDIVMQKNLIERCMADSACRNEWLKILELEHPGWPGTGNMYKNSQNVLHRNRFTLLEYFSSQNDNSRFWDIFSCIPVNCNHQYEFSKISDMFQPERMTLLL